MNDKEKLRKAFNLSGDQVKMSDKEKIKEALKVIDKLIDHYEYYLGVFVTSIQPNKVEVTKKSIEDLEVIKKILES